MRISEIKMSSQRLAAQAQSSKALVGIEFELLVPRKNNTVIPDYGYSRRVTSIDEITGFFDELNANSKSTLIRLERELENRLESWAYEQAEKEEFDSDEDKERYIRNAIFNEQEEFLSDSGLDYTALVYEEYNHILYWPYLKASEDTALEEIQAAAALFDKITGYSTIAFNGHGGPREPNQFTFEKDSTVQHHDGNANWIGAEIVSYPMAVDDAINAINNVRFYAYKVKAETNRTCGLHINISVPNYNKLDYLKLITLLGDEYVLKQFQRITNTGYAPSAAQRVRASGKLASPEAQLKIADSLRAGDMTAAQNALRLLGRLSVNFHSDRIELRSPGGNWLDQPIEKIVDTVNRLVVALEAAVDPNAHRKEYLTKAYKLIYSVRSPANKRLEDLTPIEQYRIGYINRPQLAALMTRKQAPAKLPK